MKFPEEYIKREGRVLHSRQSSDIFYDVEEAITDNDVYDFMMLNFPFYEHYVGIATGGALMAIVAHSQYPSSEFSYIKNGKLIGKKPVEEWVLIDDVATTGKSLLEAIALVGSEPKKIIVAIDRRIENKNPEVRAIFEI
ncbi:MAG: hypothetical protein U1B79_00990 [Candidatus Pacearchaeota archaeon]|nr:hypothetical protein [Nanoarchaeota archaeon]MDZ4226666.1 hypothetical protein [Candidatus Pacearchaeota archaeon]